jgi:hypothetical protein
MDLKYEPQVSDGTRKNYVHSREFKINRKKTKVNHKRLLVLSSVSLFAICVCAKINLGSNSTALLPTESVAYADDEVELIEPLVESLDLPEELSINVVIDASMEEELKTSLEEDRLAKAKESTSDVICAEEEVEVPDNSYLLDKYSYALYDSVGNRNDITADLLETLEESCAEWNVEPDLMLGVIMTESEGHANAKSSKSTATGFCQILKGTGKYVYEDILGNGKGTYNHSMAYNPELNIQMGVALMGTLQRQKGSVYRALQGYRGKSDISGYVKSINSHIGKVGLSVSSF